MTEDKGSVFVEYSIVAIVHIIYYGDVILVMHMLYYTTKCATMFSTHCVSLPSDSAAF